MDKAAINEAIENVGWVENLLNYTCKFEKKRYPQISAIISYYIREKYLVDVPIIGRKIAFLVAEMECNEKMKVRENIEKLKIENEKKIEKHMIKMDKCKREEWAEWRMCNHEQTTIADEEWEVV